MINITLLLLLLYGVKNVVTGQIVNAHMYDGQHVRIGEMNVGKESLVDDGDTNIIDGHKA